MMKQHTFFKGDGGLYIDLLIKNSKLSLMKIISFENGLSDHLHMKNTIIKTKFKKFGPKKLIYYNCKQIHCDQFKLDICNSMSTTRAHADFENNFVSVLYKSIPKKTKLLYRNQNAHSNKILWKRKMIRSRLKTKAMSQKMLLTLSSLSDNKTWWKIWNLNKQTKLKYFEKLSVDCISKTFLKACKP